PHLLKRVYFYAQKADGVMPRAEGVVYGSNVYRALATNVYDTWEDPDKIVEQWVKEGKPNGLMGFENAILKSGYDGYLNRNHFPDGAFVIIGSNKTVPVESLGARKAAAEKIAEPKLSRERHDSGVKLTRSEAGASLDIFVYGDQVPPQFT